VTEIQLLDLGVLKEIPDKMELVVLFGSPRTTLLVNVLIL
jgi:hypothetical protein